jgi:hypothetical protein
MTRPIEQQQDLASDPVMGSAVRAVQDFRAQVEAEVAQVIKDLDAQWAEMCLDERREKLPWHSDLRSPPGRPAPEDRISEMAVYRRANLIAMLRSADPDAVRELYEQINSGPQARAWQHGVAELSCLLRELIRTLGVKEV